MATGGERKAVWRLTDTRALNHNGSNFIAWTTGKKIGSIRTARIPIGGSGRASIALAIIVLVPRRVKTAPKILPAVARKRIMLTVSRVLRADSLRIAQVSFL